MSATSSEAAALISAVPESKNLNSKDHTYDTFSKASVAGSVNQEEHDNKILSSSGQHYVVYTRRWYILLLFSAICFLQAAAWNTWGPIADTAKPVLNWTDGDIALLLNMGCITYVISAFFFSWLLDVKGLRTSLLLCSTLLIIGLVIRCFPVKVEYAKWTMNAGAVLIGLSAPGINSAPPLISAVWFPQYQRTTSTAIMASSAYLGVAGSFLIGPLIVTDITNQNCSSLTPFNDSYSSYDGDDIDPIIRHNHLRKINTLLYIECAVGVFLCILAWAYDPAKPPSPPSASASVERKDFMKGAATLSRSSRFWMPALASACSLGVYNVWSTQFDTIFQHLVHVGQDDAGWIGFYSNIAGVVASLIFARLVDYLGNQMKKVLMGITIAAIVCFIWFLLLCLKIISFNIASLYISSILFSLCINSTLPIYYEVTVECVYPVAEGITTGVLTWMMNVVGLLFFLVFLIPNVGIFWMNWTTLGSIVFALLCLIFFRERYNRSHQDHQTDEDVMNQSLPSQA